MWTLQAAPCLHAFCTIFLFADVTQVGLQDRECDSAAAHAAAGGGGGVLRAVNHAAVVCEVQLLPLVHSDLGWHVACSGELSIQALPLSAYDVCFFAPDIGSGSSCYLYQKA